MLVDKKENRILQTKSIVVFLFLDEYMKLENSVRNIFQVKSLTMPLEKKQILYFYHGGEIGTQMDSSTDSIMLKEVKYSPTDKFITFSFAKIMRLNERYDLFDDLNFSIPSIRNKFTDLEFSGCAQKLIKMRNELAHNITSVTFKEQAIIESLNDDLFTKAKEDSPLLANIDTSLMDDMTKHIATNLIYLEKINKALSEKNKWIIDNSQM